MAEIEKLQAQAQKCRMLATGLSNREDVRTLEMLAAELEERARRPLAPLGNGMARPAGFEPAA